MSKSIYVGSITSSNKVLGASISTVSDSPTSREVILGLVLIGRDDYGWLISNVGPKGVAFEVPNSIVCIFLFF